MEALNKKVLIFAIILGIFTSGIIYMYIKSITESPDKIEYVKVYTATRNILPRETISEKDIRETQVAKQFVNRKAELSKAAIINRMAKEGIIEGEQILKDRLVDGESAVLSFNIPAGKRAVSINVKEDTEVANFIKAGDYVDVIATFDQDDMEINNQKITYARVTKLILQNIQILGIGQKLRVPEENSTELPKTVTLAVTPEEAEKLTYAAEFGRVRLALKAAGDNDTVQTPGIIRSDLVPDKGTAVTTK